MKIELISIIALAVDSRNITLWKPDGSTVVFPQGDLRVARIVAEAKAKGLEPGKVIEVNIAPEIAGKTEFTDAEKHTNGFVKFFKVAKAKLKEFFEDETEVRPAPQVPDIKMGSPCQVMVDKAMDTFLAIQANEPEVTVEYGDYDRCNHLLWITGYDKEHDRIGLIRFISETLNYSPERATTHANLEWPIALKAVSDDALVEFTNRLQQLKGVHWAVTNRNVTPDAYEEPKVTQGKPAEPTKQEKLAAASEKLKALGAVSTDDASFHEDVKEDEAIVAVTSAGVVPGVEGLQRHLRQASKLKDYKGFNRFLERLAPVVKDRRHSVEDLMKFMEKAELPIADDGCILFLKRLNFKETDVEGRRVFVDCHSGNIRQWVGMKVQVREDLVDPDRRRDCSNGLHVAAMSYIGSFFGNVTILGKVAPEDVFAVPEYSTNKMRVAAYHIIAELPEKERSNVCNGVYLSKTDVGKKLLNDAIVGNHSAPTDLVMVGGHMGSNLKYTQLTGGTVEQIRTTASKEALDMEESLKDNQNAEPVKALDVKPVNKPAVEIKPAKAPTVKEQILELVKEFQNATSPEDKLAAADLLVELRGKAKKPWAAFGVDSSIVDALARARSTQERLVEAKAEPVKVSKPTKAAAKPGNGKHADTIRSWLNDSGMSDYQKAHSIHDLKRAAKKSYAALGLTEEECKAIDKLKHHLK